MIQRAKDSDVAEGRLTDTSFSSPSLPPEDNFKVSLLKQFSISVHDMHVVNTVGTIIPNFTDQKVALLFRGLLILL